MPWLCVCPLRPGFTLVGWDRADEGDIHARGVKQLRAVNSNLFWYGESMVGPRTLTAVVALLSTIVAVARVPSIHARSRHHLHFATLRCAGIAARCNSLRGPLCVVSRYQSGRPTELASARVREQTARTAARQQWAHLASSR